MSAQPAAVEADLNYLLDTGERPVGYAYPAPPGVPQQSGASLPTRVRIANARRLPEQPSLDREGFELRSAPTAVCDFSDPKAILERYYPETQSLLRAVTGAVSVVVFDHTMRLGVPGHAEACASPCAVSTTTRPSFQGRAACATICRPRRRTSG
jgi:hypothetical protein